MSGVVYYDLSPGEIHFGRKTGDPVPQIILGAYGIKPNHAKITLLENGLFELSVCDADAAQNTMVNGKSLPKKLKKVLNHLDRICFVGSIIYVFYYPLLNIETLKILEANAAENADLTPKIQRDQAWADIQDNGIAGFTSVKCADYKHVEEDKRAITWDSALDEVEACIEAQKQKQKKDQENQVARSNMINKKLKEQLEKEKEALEEENKRKMQELQEQHELERKSTQEAIARQREEMEAEAQKGSISSEKQAELERLLEERNREIEFQALELQKKKAQYELQL